MAKKAPSTANKATEGGEITVFTYAPTARVSGRQGAFETGETLGMFGFTERSAKVSAEKLQSNLKNFLFSMETAMKGIPVLLAGYALEEIELSLEVGAEGEIGLLGTGGKLSGKGSISLKLKRPAPLGGDPKKPATG